MIITKEAKGELRNLIVKANLALHLDRTDELLCHLRSALIRANSIGISDIEPGSNLKLDMAPAAMDSGVTLPDPAGIGQLNLLEGPSA